MIKKLYWYLPKFSRNFLTYLWYRFFQSKLFNAYKQHKFSDEYLKFVHLFESINYLKVAGNYGEVLPLSYYEFGCHSGRTFSAVVNSAKFLGLDKMQYFAFDSFEGLPNTNYLEDGFFKRGTFSTSKEDFLNIIKKQTNLLLEDKNIIKGFYSDSLTADLQKKLPKIGVVHIDVDLYSSTKEVLNFIKPLLIPGSIILFDDWYCFPPGKNLGEQKAFNEFLDINNNFRVQEWKSYSTFGKSFFIISV